MCWALRNGLYPCEALSRGGVAGLSRRRGCTGAGGDDEGDERN